eukprot:scaffold11456_cov75-Phaeocystis_antarctica.AAC.1
MLSTHSRRSSLTVSSSRRGGDMTVELSVDTTLRPSASTLASSRNVVPAVGCQLRVSSAGCAARMRAGSTAETPRDGRASSVASAAPSSASEAPVTAVTTASAAGDGGATSVWRPPAHVPSQSSGTSRAAGTSAAAAGASASQAKVTRPSASDTGAPEPSAEGSGANWAVKRTRSSPCRTHASKLIAPERSTRGPKALPCPQM